MVSGLTFADHSMRILGTAEGLQEQVEKALEYCRKWGRTADEKKCALCT